MGGLLTWTVSALSGPAMRDLSDAVFSTEDEQAPISIILPCSRKNLAIAFNGYIPAGGLHVDDSLVVTVVGHLNLIGRFSYKTSL